MADLYTTHKNFIEANTVTEHNMVDSCPEQLQIASKLLPYFKIALINFGKKLYDCKVVDYHYHATNGKEGKIIVDFANPDSAAHLFATPITIPSRNNQNETFQTLLQNFFTHINSKNCDKDFIEPVESISINKDIDIIEKQLDIMLNTLLLVNNINDKQLQNEIINLYTMISNFNSMHQIITLSINQQKRLSAIIATAKVELENANRAHLIFEELKSIEFQKECFNILTSNPNPITTYQQLMTELSKTYKVCSIPDKRVIQIIKSVIDLSHFNNVNQKLKNGYFDDGLVSFKHHLKNYNEYWIFDNLSEDEINEYIDIIYDFSNFLDLSSADLNNFIKYVSQSYKTQHIDKLNTVIEKTNANKYETIINEILAILTINQISLSTFDDGHKLKDFYFNNFHYFSHQIKTMDEFNELIKFFKNTKPKHNYDIQFNQIINGGNVINDIDYFINNDKNFLSELPIAKYYIIEKLEQKCLAKNLDFDILSSVFTPSNIQLSYMLTEYQLQLDKTVAGYESYQDFLKNGTITTSHNWLALYYNLLGSQEFMSFIATQPLIPNFAKTARKLSLITTICNIGELDYEVEIGKPNNGKKEKEIYSLKFGKLQVFGNFQFAKGKQIVLEIEHANQIYKINSLKADAPVGDKTIKGIKMLRIIYIVNEKALTLLKRLGLKPQSNIIAPRKIIK